MVGAVLVTGKRGAKVGPQPISVWAAADADEAIGTLLSQQTPSKRGPGAA